MPTSPKSPKGKAAPLKPLNKSKAVKAAKAAVKALPEPKVRRLNGRQTECTPEVIEHICDGVRAGNYAKTCCRAVGISEATYYRWLEQGRLAVKEGRQDCYRDFLESVDAADAEAQITVVRTWKSHFGEEPAAVRDFAERRWRGDYSKNEATTNIQTTGRVTINFLPQAQKPKEEKP